MCACLSMGQIPSNTLNTVGLLRICNVFRPYLGCILQIHSIRLDGCVSATYSDRIRLYSEDTHDAAVSLRILHASKRICNVSDHVFLVCLRPRGTQTAQAAADLQRAEEKQGGMHPHHISSGAPALYGPVANATVAFDAFLSSD